MEKILVVEKWDDKLLFCPIKDKSLGKDNLLILKNTFLSDTMMTNSSKTGTKFYQKYKLICSDKTVLKQHAWRAYHEISYDPNNPEWAWIKISKTDAIKILEEKIKIHDDENLSKKEEKELRDLEHAMKVSEKRIDRILGSMKKTRTSSWWPW